MSMHRIEIDTLNTLTATVIDSVRGYDQAAEVAERPEIAGEFTRFADQRRRAAAALQTKVRALGGEAETEGSTMEAAHRFFLNLRAMFQTDTRAAILEVERGEDYLKEQVADALADQRLEADTHDLIRDCYQEIRIEHESWSRVCHVMAA